MITAQSVYYYIYCKRKRVKLMFNKKASAAKSISQPSPLLNYASTRAAYQPPDIEQSSCSCQPTKHQMRRPSSQGGCFMARIMPNIAAGSLKHES